MEVDIDFPDFITTIRHLKRVYGTIGSKEKLGIKRLSVENSSNY
jgi:hypothetical protein